MSFYDIAADFEDLRLLIHEQRFVIGTSPAIDAHRRLKRIRDFYRSLPRCGQCGQSYFERACGPTHAALAAPMMTPGEAQRQRTRYETLAAPAERAIRFLRNVSSFLPSLSRSVAKEIADRLEAATPNTECIWCENTGLATAAYPYCHFECEDRYHKDRVTR